MNKPKQVVIHPLVLLSVVDHYNRVVGKGARNRRVMGTILGEWSQGNLDATNSFAVPFEEDTKESQVWFVDANYHETMYNMFRKVNAREKVIGWYTTGTHFKQHDIEINELYRQYCPNPILVIIDVEHSDSLALPTDVYVSQEMISENGQTIKSFSHIPSVVEAFEPEEIGVEHLLREIKDISLNSLTNQVNNKLNSLKGMISKILQIKNYLEQIIEKNLTPNNQIIFNLQEIMNLLPNLNEIQIQKSFAAKNNDQMFVLYVCSLIRSIISLHTLINNKQQNKDAEKKEEKEQEEKKEKIKEKSQKAKEQEEKQEDKKEKN